MHAPNGQTWQLADCGNGMAPDDRLYLPDPVYQGGTVERTRGSDWLAEQVNARGKYASHIPERPRIGEALLAEHRRAIELVVCK